MGDSFMEANFESPVLSHELEQATGKSVYNVPRKELLDFGDNPLAYLKDKNFQKGKKKYIVVETTERYALERSVLYQSENYITDPQSETSAENKAQADSDNAKVNSTLKDFTDYTKNSLDTENLKYFFYNNWISAPFVTMGKNFRFEVLNEIDPRMPEYSKKPPMLFYIEDINFVKRQIGDEYINMMATNVKTLKDTLLEKYNLELIYVQIPTKYSIYGHYSPLFTKYNDFIPRAAKAFSNKGINTFDLYTIYKNSDNIDSDPLYYKGDTHYTPRGKTMVVNEIRKFIK
jgi:hypothetical protein